MSESILVAYATTYGSTKEVAEAVLASLRESGLEADIQPVRKVRSLAGYGAVVLGAPLYLFHWHKDARRFLLHHREALIKLPTAIFALGPFNGEEKDFEEARAQLQKELQKTMWLEPAVTVMFGGKYDPAKLSFPYNLVPALKQMPASDVRDWEAIRNWAGGLASVFGGRS